MKSVFLRKIASKMHQVKSSLLVYLNFPELRSTRKASNEEIHLKAAMAWLCLAQDESKCDGILSLYNLDKKSWGKPYRETTGYIIPTFINYSKKSGIKEFEERALRMGEWELKEQLNDGSYGEETISGQIRKKVFNTGQVMLGLCSLYDHTGEEKYLKAVIKSAEWLLSIQENNGSWQQFTTAGARTYHSRVAWSLLEVYKRTGNKKYKEAAEKNIEWVLAQQNENGWFENTSLSNPSKPWTHLIAYTIQGLIESASLLESDKIFQSAYKTSLKILRYYENEKNNNFDYLPGTFDKKWQSKDDYTCLTGDAQIAITWLKIWNITNEEHFRSRALCIIDQIKETQIINSSHPEITGGIAGSYPFGGEYASFTMLNWATKFFIDALLLKNNPEFSLLG